jgi:uncharacterized protein YwgA
MKPSQKILKLILDTLNTSSDWSSLENRRIVQKSLYIIQEAGANIGYLFRWYSMGPSSPELTRDCFQLNTTLSLDDTSFSEFELHDDVKNILDSISPLLTPPEDVKLCQADWLELVASLLFIMKEKSTISNAPFKIQSKRSYLLEYQHIAIEKIDEILFHGKNPYLKPPFFSSSIAQ